MYGARKSALTRHAGGLALAVFTLGSTQALAAAAVDTNNLGPVDVELPTIIAPMIVDSELENYAYITISLKPASPNGVLVIREKVPFLQDAILRELNGATIVKADDPKAVDEVGLKARLLTRVNQILPPGTVAELTFDPIVVAPILLQR